MNRQLRTISVSLALLLCSLAASPAQKAPAESDSDWQRRAAWFLQGREAPRGKSAAELRRRAVATKMQMRAARLRGNATSPSDSTATGPWTPLGPLPLASDATGSGLQDYHQVSGRATAIAIDPADPTGNTIFVGGAQSGIWKSTNAANPIAAQVNWTPLTDSQPALAIGAIAIQPGNANPSQSVIIAATGEADNSGDSYFGAGMLRSADGGQTWTNVSTASYGSSQVSLAGLGGTAVAFSTAQGQTNTVVAAMATSSEAYLDGAYDTNTVRGLYTSTDGGEDWAYDTLIDPSGPATSASATSVVYNAAAQLFIAAVRYHGFYSSPDGLNWTRLANQPGAAGLLSTANCPPASSSSCLLYRAEITVVPGRNEMYTWFIGIDPATGDLLDEGIWQTTNGGSQWTQISDAGITQCGDPAGCGISQGPYNLELLAVPDGSATDIYAGAINLYKCSITTANPACHSTSFLNLTHVYGCAVLGAPAHVHPDQHALASILPGNGTDLMYFANDGGIYRALDGYAGLTTGSCSGTNQFDDLNQNLGPMTQFVAFSQHPSDTNTLLGGTQDNGSPATASSTSSARWINVLGGDGGYNAIDPNTPANWFTSNPDGGNGSLQIYLCPSGIHCDDSTFAAVVDSGTVGGDDGPFYPFYVLDPQSSTAMLVGTCRLWRGPRVGGTFTALSPNLETFGSGTCTGSEANTVRSIAAGGPTDANGSQVVYVTTNGLGPNNNVPSGRVWVSLQASQGPASFSDITGTINPMFYSISSAAIDVSDPSGKTAFVSIMGFTGGPGHVWQTTDGATWVDFSGTGAAALPDSPVNALLVDASTHTVYAGTDAGVFQSSTTTAEWTEVGPTSGDSGLLPNVAITGLGLFDSGGLKLLRASTYGRGIWQFGIFSVPTFQVAVPTPGATVFNNQAATLAATVTAYGGYNNLVNMTCTGGTTAPPQNCSASPASVTPTFSGASTTLAASGTAGNYIFNLHAVGTDAKQITIDTPITLTILDFGLTTPSPNSVTIPRGTSSAPISFQATAGGPFSQPVTLTCLLPDALSGATCAISPQATVNPTASSPVSMTAMLTVPPSVVPGTYPVTIEADTTGAPSVTTTFSAVITTNPDFILVEPAPFPDVPFGSTGTTAPISINSQDGFSGTVALSCAAASGGDSCSLNPSTVGAFPATVSLTINGDGPTPGSYSMNIVGKSGTVSHTLAVPFNVSGFSFTGPASISATAGNPAQANLTLTSAGAYQGNVNLVCDTSALGGAQCSFSPPGPISLSAGASVKVVVTINVPNDTPAGMFPVNLQARDASGVPVVSLKIQVTISQDYTIGALSPPGASVSPGGSASFNLSVIPIGTYNGSIQLNCAVAPVFMGSCAFTPASVSPGSNVTGVSALLTVTTVAPVPGAQPRSAAGGWRLAACMMLPLLVLPGFKRNRPACRARIAGLCLVAWISMGTLSCGTGVGGSGGGGGQHGTQPGIYTITVTGSPASTSQPKGSVAMLMVN